MPNLKKPITSLAKARRYQKKIINELPKNSRFKPLMTLYLTEETNLQEIKNIKKNDLITAIKYYPSGVTTNSTIGVKNVDLVMPILEQMSKLNIPLCIHGESPNETYDIFDREKIFIEEILDKIRRRLPELKITFEHITTTEAIDYIKSAKMNLGATITVHHLLINRNHLFYKGIRPHYYCLPLAKREIHRKNLVKCATSGDKRFFLGTDSAPHLSSQKQSACGCAGIFSAPYAVPLLTGIFDRENKLKNLEKFLSINGALHYEIQPNTEMITLQKKEKPQKLKELIRFKGDKIFIFGPEFKIHWKVRKKNG